MINRTFLGLICGLFIVLSSCNSQKNAAGEKIKKFVGSIIYDIEIKGNENNTQWIEKEKQLLGNTMTLSVYRNGDILMNYEGSDSGYDIRFLDVKKNLFSQKFNTSDTLYSHDAARQNVVKLNDIRKITDSVITVLDLECKHVSLAGEKIKKGNSLSKFVVLNYWYSENIRIDQSKYANVNENLLGYLLSKSKGGLYLKYQVDYFSHTVTYTAREIKPNTVENVEDFMDESIIRVEN